MHLAHVCHNGDIRCGNGRKCCNLSKAAHADLHDGCGIRLRDAQQRQRQPDFVVVVRRCSTDRPTSREDGSRQILRRRLSVRAGNCNDGNIELHAPRVRNRLIRLERVLHREDSALLLTQVLFHRL